MNLQAIDTHLIIALDALLRERSVSGAARALDLGQPAMSHALGRLRRHFGDPLLERHGNAMVRTPMAESLAAPVGEAVVQLRRVFQPAGGPGRGRVFRIAASDNLELYVAPRLVGLAGADVAFQFRPLSPDWPELLARGELDLKLGRGYALPPGLEAAPLSREELVCVVREGHPCLSAPWTLAAYLELAHAAVAPGAGDPGLVDERLAAMGLRRQVVLRLAHFLAAPHLAAASDLALTVPRRLHEAVGPLQLVALPLPLDDAGYWLTQVWASRTGASAEHAWLRAAIAGCF